MTAICKRAILGSRGPLTNSERGAVLASLPPDQSADALQRQFALQQALSDSPLVTGNTATILRDGAQAFPAMFAAMQRRATTSTWSISFSPMWSAPACRWRIC